MRSAAWIRSPPPCTTAGLSHVPGDLVVGDVRDPAAVDEALAGVDAVCHQAAMVGLGVDLSDLPMYSDVNVTGTAVLLEAMGRHGIGRLVFASSMVVYGEGAYDCASHGRVRPSAPGPGRPGRGAVRAALPGMRVAAGYGHGRRGGAAGPAQRLRREQGGAGAPGGQLGPADRRRRGRAALPQRVRAADAAGHPLLGRGRDLPLLPGERRAAAGVRGRRPAPRLRARPRRGPGQPAGPVGGF